MPKEWHRASTKVKSYLWGNGRPRRLLTLHRGHWTVENRNDHARDVTFGEDSSRICTGWGPASNAALNNLALAIVLRRKARGTVPQALTRFSVRREEALAAILQPV